MDSTHRAEGSNSSSSKPHTKHSRKNVPRARSQPPRVRSQNSNVGSTSTSHSSPRFGHLLGSTLGSPFLTTLDAVELLPEFDFIDGESSSVSRSQTVTRPPSPSLIMIAEENIPPSPTDRFSIITSSEVAGVDVFSDTQNYTYTYTIPSRSSFFGNSTPIRKKNPLYSSPSLAGTFVNAAPTLGTPLGRPQLDRHSPYQSHNAHFVRSWSGSHSPHAPKGLIPRLWDALSSPSRPRPLRARSQPRARTTGGGSISASTSGDSTTSSRPVHLSSPFNTLRKGKARASYSILNVEPTSVIDYATLPPLDGEEGELIDDEACFPFASPSESMSLSRSSSFYIPSVSNLAMSITRAIPITGTDIISFLPTELSLYIITEFLDLETVLAAKLVCRRWRALASDCGVWRSLFIAESSPGSFATGEGGRGWALDIAKANARDRKLPLKTTVRNPRLRYSDASSLAARSLQSMHRRSLAVLREPEEIQESEQDDNPMSEVTAKADIMQAPLTLDWQEMYRERLQLDRRWASPEFQPPVRKIEGHGDSVYCLEFDSRRIITGSRDKTIKVWDLATGRLQGTFRGHAGSVLCLKFDWPSSPQKTGAKARPPPKGFMVSGSSDTSIGVWSLWEVKEGEEVKATVKSVLKGHSGGVLDLRIDKKWIVSCSKDALIRIWDRKTLALCQTLKGHEGPVNALGLSTRGPEAGFVVSASGDGKMILWDIESGRRLRTFEHDRGLACIEFKDNIIVSGSNDCKIKIWDVITGECIQTLGGHDLLVRALSFDLRSGRLVSASYDKSVKVWDMSTGELLRDFKNCHSSHIFDVKFDVGRIVSTSHDQKIVILDFASGLDTSLFV